MRATPSDPRVNERENELPAYWVVFRDDRGTWAEQFRLSEVRDVHEVLAWAESNAGGRVIELYVEAEPGHVVRLLGRRPGAAP